ncbi:MAG: ATP synthase F1 subunit gamma [Calditrichaeota bacterium]|nr:ATP synthase F1 subunit gamma [Calditrichota bacterium]
MPSLKQIKRRITGVKSTAQITRAMKMVAAAKLKRTQTNMERSRPYSRRLSELIAALAAHTDASLHPLLAVRPPERVGVVAVTSDRGLCGSFNANICRRTQRVLREHESATVELFTIGRKGYDFFRKRGVRIHKHFPGVFHELEFSQAAAIGAGIVDLYTSGDFDRIYLVYNEFKNAIQQRIIAEQLLPVDTSGILHTARSTEFVYEPSPEAVLDKLLPLFVNIKIWHVLLESYAAEQGARMSAMENATDNATELLSDLSLQYNKARQAAITKELLEIVGGAEGLK